MELLSTLLIDLFITAIAYLLIPLIMVLTEKQFELSKIKKIIIINGLCVWLIFTIVRIELGIDGTSFAVILWSYVAYLIMKKKCLKNDDKQEPTNTAKDSARKLTDTEKRTNLKKLFSESSRINTGRNKKTKIKSKVVMPKKENRRTHHRKKQKGE